MKADEGLKLEVMQVVSIQSENCQAVKGSQSLTVNLGDVVVTQLENLYRWMGFKTGGHMCYIHSHTE